MKIEVCKGHAGLALYVDDVRVAGPRHNGMMETVLSAEIPEDPQPETWGQWERRKQEEERGKS